MSPQDAAPDMMRCRRLERVIGDHLLVVDAIDDVDALLGHYAGVHGDNVDMIPYYAMLWPAAEALAAHLEGQFTTLHGVRVLELGCGLGLPAMMAATLGAQVVAVDFHPDCPAFLERNLALNALASVTAQCCDWTALSHAEPFDLVIGSDLLYERKNIESLATAVGRLCSPGGRVMLGDPGRDHLQRAVNRICEEDFVQETSVYGNCFVVTFDRG